MWRHAPKNIENGYVDLLLVNSVWNEILSVNVSKVFVVVVVVESQSNKRKSHIFYIWQRKKNIFSNASFVVRQ